MIEKLRSYWKAAPFVPFGLHWSDGRVLHVPHPDYFAMGPRGGEIWAWEENSDQVHLVNPIVLVSVTRPEPAASGEMTTQERN